MSLNEIINEALNSEIDKLWIEESMKRVQAIKDGTLKTVSYEDVFTS